MNEEEYLKTNIKELIETCTDKDILYLIYDLLNNEKRTLN